MSWCGAFELGLIASLTMGVLCCPPVSPSKVGRVGRKIGLLRLFDRRSSSVSIWLGVLLLNLLPQKPLISNSQDSEAV